MAIMKTYNATDLTGGTARSLNSISESVLLDNDRGHVAYGDNFYVYVYDASAIDAESSPAIIRPSDYVSSGVWKNQVVLGAVKSVSGVDVDNTDPENPIIAGITEVEILAVGSNGAGSYNLPGVDEWTDYEKVEILGSRSSALAGQDTTNAATIISKEQIAADTIGFISVCLMPSVSTEYKTTLTSTGVDSFDISVAEGAVVYQVKAYKKE